MNRWKMPIHLEIYGKRFKNIDIKDLTCEDVGGGLVKFQYKDTSIIICGKFEGKYIQPKDWIKCITETYFVVSRVYKWRGYFFLLKFGGEPEFTLRIGWDKVNRIPSF